MPAACSPRAPHTHEPRPAVWRWASPFSAVDVPQNGVVEHRLRQQLLQPRVLILRVPLAAWRPIPPTPRTWPCICKTSLRDPVLAANLCRRQPRLMLARDPDDLLLAEPAFLHRPSLLSVTGSTPLEEFSGLRSGATRQAGYASD